MTTTMDANADILGNLVLLVKSETEDAEHLWNSPHQAVVRRVISLQSSQDSTRKGYIIGCASRDLFRKVREWANLHPSAKLYCVQNSLLNALLSLKEQPQQVERLLRDTGEWQAQDVDNDEDPSSTYTVDKPSEHGWW